jgi:phosphate transport system protein
MGELAEKTVSLSFDCYTKGIDVYERVQTWSETLVSLSEEVEEKAIELIARYQPVASDLRTIKSYMKIAYDLSRYGRYAWDITFIYKRLSVKLNECTFSWMLLKEISEKVLEMVHTSIEAIKKHDVNLAKTLGAMENDVDNMYYKYLDKLVEQAPTTTKCVVSNLLFIRHLERIADHAAYIGESVIYLVTGERISLR